MTKLSQIVSRLRVSQRTVLEGCGLAVLFGIAALISSALFSERHINAVASGEPAISLGITELCDSDKQHYSNIFALQQAKHFDEANAELAQVSNPILKGMILAQRSLSDKIHADVKPAEPKSFSSGGGRSTLHATSGGDWTAGLAAYRRHDMSGAAEHFRALLGKDLSSEDRAAAAFWAYRAVLATGDGTGALQYAQQAAKLQPSFYSILARRVVAENAADKNDTASQLETVAPLLSQDAVRRAIALKQIGQDTLAEQELRSLFGVSDKAERDRLATLATALDLPAVQMQIALQSDPDGEQAKGMIYPMPHWKPTNGYHIEPALLFAIMRQESGFNPNAKNASGASGVMQLMPETARGIDIHLAAHSALPAVSMTLGQNYIQRLMETSIVGDNLVFLTAAYNAGPGTVANWQHSLHAGDDPLLFVESIPYAETRDYVVRVIGNYWVYSQLMGGHDVSSVLALSQGQWPHYAGTSKQLVSMSNRLGMVE